MLLDEKQIAKELTIAILQKLNLDFYKDDYVKIDGTELLEKASNEVSKLYSLMCKAVVKGED